MNELLEDLRAYDGKALTILGEIQARQGSRSTYVADIVALTASTEAHVSDGATWLLKAYLEGGGTLSAAATRRLFDSLEQVTAWQAQLHLCQMMEYLNVAATQASAVATWLKPLLQHKRPFLRAWSMSALQHLAARHPAFAADAEVALKAAAIDGAGSVRARARFFRVEVSDR